MHPIEVVHSSITFRSCRVVDFPEMKPNCLLLKSLLADMCFTIISLTSKVVVNGTESKCHHVTSGIPQGSVLGPILFVIYINDMPEMVESSTYLFADDTKITNTPMSFFPSDCSILLPSLLYR
jgi:hypothetical protein